MGLKGILSGMGLNALGIAMLVLAMTAFVGILIWTFTRSKEQMEADSRLWKDEEE
jgi:uncharacterized membrane protein YbaN (DUF454 family)